MKALIVGANGQIGQALRELAPPGYEIVAPTRDELDITNRAATTEWLIRCHPTVVFNAAAYTQVDRAQEEPDRARAVNATAVGWIADGARSINARFVHLSTDFVFDGSSSRAYRPDDATNPLNVYGQTKREGELAAKANHPEALIVRTSWVYSPRGHNFMGTMLRLMRERDEIRVVVDQIGTPTLASSVASALWKLANKQRSGILHYCDSGVASWYDFAMAIQEESVIAGILSRTVPITPISSDLYPMVARRPSFSVLDCRETSDVLGTCANHWRVNLRKAIRDIAA